MCVFVCLSIGSALNHSEPFICLCVCLGADIGCALITAVCVCVCVCAGISCAFSATEPSVFFVCECASVCGYWLCMESH